MPGDYASLNESSVAGTVAAEYVGSERMKFSTRLEARRATSLDSYRTPRPWPTSCRRTGPCCCATACSWTRPRRQRRRRDPAAPADRRGLPPGGQRPLHFLTRYEHRAERLSGAATSYLARPAAWTRVLASGLRQDTHILSAHANWQPVSKLTLSGRYAFKWTTDESNGLSSKNWAHLVYGRAMWDLARRWDAGVQAFAMTGRRRAPDRLRRGRRLHGDARRGCRWATTSAAFARPISPETRRPTGRIPAPADEIRRIAVRGSGRMTMQSTLDRCPRKPRWLPALMIAARCCCHRWSRPMGNRGPSSTPALTSCSTGEPEDGTEWRAHVGRCPLRNRHPDRCMAGWQSTHPPRNSMDT